MAINLKKKFADYYDFELERILDSNNFISDNKDEMLELFRDFGLTNEEVSKALVDYYIKKDSIIIEKISGVVLSILELEEKNQLVANQASQVTRQIQGYDDNIVVKIAEFESGLASFAVNAGSDTAQSTIDKLNNVLDILYQRIEQLQKNDESLEVTQL